MFLMEETFELKCVSALEISPQKTIFSLEMYSERQIISQSCKVFFCVFSSCCFLEIFPLSGSSGHSRSRSAVYLPFGRIPLGNVRAS